MKLSEAMLEFFEKNVPKKDFTVACRKVARGEMSHVVLRGGLHGKERLYIVSSDYKNNHLKGSLHPKPPHDSRFLIIGNQSSPDTIAKRVIDLNIRNRNRFYAFSIRGKKGDEQLKAISSRLFANIINRNVKPAILDVEIEGNTLAVISTSFEKLNVPLEKLLFCKGATLENLTAFEIDDEGSFVYWPSLDMHLGWGQFQAIVDPATALKARQKSKTFNKAFGAAIRKLREITQLKQTDIKELSDRQLQRIESGESRATSSAIKALATAHKMTPNNYLDRVSKLLGHMEASRVKPI